MRGTHRCLLGALTLSAALLAAAACSDSPAGPTMLKSPLAKARRDCLVLSGMSLISGFGLVPTFATVPYDPGDGTAVSCWSSDSLTVPTVVGTACWAYSTVSLTCDDGSSW